MKLSINYLAIITLVVIASGIFYLLEYIQIIKPQGSVPTPPTMPQLSLIPIITLNTFPESKLDNEFELTANIKSIYDVSNFSAQFEFPEGITFISGNLTWNGYLKANETIEFSIRVKAMKVGNWNVKLATNTAISSERCISINETNIFYCLEPESSFPELLTESPTGIEPEPITEPLLPV